jgi:hypothetical protein
VITPKAKRVGSLIAILSAWTVVASVPATSWAGKGSHYSIARECAQLALPRADYQTYIDKLMADNVQEQVASSPRLHEHQAIIVKIYQESAREFLARTNAVDKMWDQAARKLAKQFSDAELRAVKGYLTRKTGREFLDTPTGKKWEREAERLVRSGVNDANETLRSKYDLFVEIVQQKTDSYKAQGKVPDDL